FTYASSVETVARTWRTHGMPTMSEAPTMTTATTSMIQRRSVPGGAAEEVEGAAATGAAGAAGFASGWSALSCPAAATPGAAGSAVLPDNSGVPMQRLLLSESGPRDSVIGSGESFAGNRDGGGSRAI